MIRLAAAPWLLSASLAVASDGVISFGPLSDRAFFRLIACGAEPGGLCNGPVVHWQKHKIRIYSADVPDGYPPGTAALIPEAIDRAISQINAAGANLQLELTDDPDAADIKIRPSLMAENQRTKNIPGIPDGQAIGVGFVFMRWNETQHLTDATILLSKSLLPYDTNSIVLEELFQALGFRFDIENRYYKSRSVVSQNSNAITKITGQDAIALRKMYPPH